MNARITGNRVPVGQDTLTDSEPIAGRYTLDRIIGSGAAAVVYEGHDVVSDQTVAVKVYRQDGSVLTGIQQSREIEALANLRHEGLVTLYDGGTETCPDGRTYLVTDLVDGPTLAERLKGGPLDVATVRDLAVSLAEALAHVHSRGFIHRDIKPANILLDEHDQPRLADFGIARALDGTVATATGAIAGTAAYLAPEQARGEAVESPADVYALGLVLLEALTGRREYPGTAVESATARLFRRPVVPAGLPWHFTALLKSMTDPDPARRPTAADVAAALADDPPAAAGRAPVTPARRFRPRGVLPALVAAGLLLACLLGGASLVFNAGGWATSARPAATTAALVPVPVTPTPAVAPAPEQSLEKAVSLSADASTDPAPATPAHTARPAAVATKAKAATTTSVKAGATAKARDTTKAKSTTKVKSEDDD
ncbi:MAG: eukaryotic-like serine/threonine-protein kinase [Pseudonocardiales bacterium]|nr:eukaryotic-like serine/threonine-protein kinase [Pseudonocardiales bacterium]